MKVRLTAYRNWAKRIYAALPNKYEYVDHGEADLALFFGQSDRVPAHLLKSAPCFGLHPAPLPRYRGGSPIQNQIINGETESAVTIFQMTEATDSGPIYAQVPITLDGSLSDVFDRIVDVAIEPTRRLLDEFAQHGRVLLTEQKDVNATYCRRRQPDESEIDFSTAHQAYNQIRALYTLDEDYPTAFVVCDDGTRLYLTGSKEELHEVPQEARRDRGVPVDEGD